MQIFCFHIRTNTKPAQFRDDISILGTMNTLLKIKMRRSVQAIKNSNRKHIFRLVIGVWTKACETNEVINVHFNKIEWNWCPTSTIHKQWRKQQRKINRYSVLCSTNSSNVIKTGDVFSLSLFSTTRNHHHQLTSQHIHQMNASIFTVCANVHHLFSFVDWTIQNTMSIHRRPNWLIHSILNAYYRRCFQHMECYIFENRT